MANYSQSDFISVYEDLLSIIEASTSKWNPRTSTEADPGVVILKLMALLEDKFNYKFDMAQAQGYLDSVSNIDYAKDLLYMLGYTMKLARASSGLVGIGINASNPPVDTVTIPMFSIITDGKQVTKFFTTSKTTIPTTNPTQTTFIEVMAGTPIQITKSGSELFSLKDIDESGRLALGRTGLAQNGIFIMTQNRSYSETNDWKYLDLAIASLKNQKFFTVSTLESGEIYIQFPDNFEELVADNTFKIYATATSGISSNITRNTLNRFNDENLNTALLVYQTTDFQSGQNSETIEEARNNYYAQKDLCNTLVSSEDFRVAIRFLLNTDGSRKFSNVLTASAIDRATRIRTTYQQSDFIYLQADSTEPSFQIDVVPMQYSSSYLDSFKVLDDNLNALSNSISTGLADYKAISTTISATTQNKRNEDPADYSRILAVTTPKMRIRVTSYTMERVAQIRELVKNYFYSNYKNDVLTLGKPLDFTKVQKEIKALASDIQSVEIRSFEYDCYDSFMAVDGGAYSSRSSLNTKLRDYIVNNSAISGALPVFKYSNRPNTQSKDSTAYKSYSLADDSSSVEITTPLPWGVQAIESTEDRVSPTITDLVTSLAWDLQDPAGEPQKRIDLNGNHILQIRRATHTSEIDYGYGMQYSFYSDSKINYQIPADIQVIYSSKLYWRTTLAKNSVIYPTQQTFLSQPFSFKTSQDGETYGNQQTISTLEVGMYYKLMEADGMAVQSGNPLLMSDGSIIKSGSVIAPSSLVNKFAYYPPGITSDVEYCIQANECLCIFNSSGEIKATLEEGVWVLSNGLDIPTTAGVSATPAPVSGQTISSAATITQLKDDLSIIPKTYVYMLSLRSAAATKVITAAGYMLEEEEFFVYATGNVSEYILLGPGTVISSVSGIETLVNTSFTTQDTLQISDFLPLPNPLRARSYELTTYRKPKYMIHNIRDDTEASRFPINWKALDEYSVLKVYAEEETLDGTPPVETLVKNFSANPAYEARLLALVEADTDGVAVVEYPISFTMNYGLGSPILVTTETNSIRQLTSNIPFTALLNGEHNQLLLSPGISAVVQSNKINRTSMSGSNFTWDYSAFDFNIDVIEDPDPQAVLGLYNIDTNLFVPSNTKMILANMYVYLPGDQSYKLTAKVSTSVVTLATDVELSNDYRVISDFTLAVGSDIKSGSIIAANSKLGGEVYTTNKTLTSDVTSGAGDVIKSGSVIEQGSTLKSGSIIAAREEEYCHILSSMAQEEYTIDVHELDLLSYSNNTSTILIPVLTDELIDSQQMVVAIPSYTEDNVTYTALPKSTAIYFTELSYVTDYSTELVSSSNARDIDSQYTYTQLLPLSIANSETVLTNDTIVKNIATLDTSNKFNWISYPSEQLSSPLDSNNYFNTAHPLNGRTAVYINWNQTDIIVEKN